MEIDEFIKIDYINKYRETIINKNYSLCTLNAYMSDLLGLFNYVNKALININESDIKAYIIYLNKAKMSPSSVRRKISTFKSFYKFLYKNNYMDKKKYPMNKVVNPKLEKRLPKFVYYSELLEIIDAAENTKNGIRDKLIIELLYATGLRVSELTNIKISDIDFNNRKIKVLGKGNKERIVFYGEYAEDALNEYLNSGVNKGEKYLFINNKNVKMTDRSIEYIIDNIMKKLSIKTHVTPHVLRHTFATDMLNNGCDIKVVQEILGHSSLKATEIYTHVTNERIKEVYYNCFPRGDEK